MMDIMGNELAKGIEKWYKKFQKNKSLKRKLVLKGMLRKLTMYFVIKMTGEVWGTVHSSGFPNL